MKLNKSNVKSIDVDPNKIWDKLIDFSSYSFNKSHALAYSMLAYQTAKVWTYHRDQFLEMQLNYAGGKKSNAAAAKCEELNFKTHFPKYDNMKGDKYKIENGNLYLPGGFSENYYSYIDMFTSDNWTGQMVLKGVCDDLTKDREALLEMFSIVLKKSKEKLRWAESKEAPIKSLKQLLEAMLLAGCITNYEDEYEKDENGNDRKTGNKIVYVKRFRNKPDTPITIHSDKSIEVINQVVKYDKKFFGTIRKGTIGNKPEVRGEYKIPERILRYRDKQIQRSEGKIGIGSRPLNDMIKNEMWDILREMNINIKDINPDNTKCYFPKVRCLVEDVRKFDTSTKISCKFADANDFYYIKNAEFNRLGGVKKGDLLEVDFMFSPFIRLRTSEYISDFDIVKIEKC